MTDKTNSQETASAATNPTTSTSNLRRRAYTLKETAQILGISYISAHRLVQRGLLRSSKALRTKLIPEAEIERFLAE